MASLTQWTWVWAGSRCWWWTGRPGMLPSMGSQRVRPAWATELIGQSWVSFQGWFNVDGSPGSLFLCFIHGHLKAGSLFGLRMPQLDPETTRLLIYASGKEQVSLSLHFHKKSKMHQLGAQAPLRTVVKGRGHTDSINWLSCMCHVTHAQDSFMEVKELASQKTMSSMAETSLAHQVSVFSQALLSYAVLGNHWACRQTVNGRNH